MDMIKLAEEIIAGKRLCKGEDLDYFRTCDLDDLCRGADKLRKHFDGDKVDLCSIINGRSGKCPEDCKYCAQSAYNHTNCEIYDFIPQEKIISACRENAEEGADRFSVVTAGKALSGGEFEKALKAFECMKRECGVELCASLGFLNRSQFERLKSAGVVRYHHNMETSRRHFPNICTTHTYDRKYETLKMIKSLGIDVCSGGIIGMGEDMDDRIDLALDLAAVGVSSIPINVLMPIKGTPLWGTPPLEENEILRTAAMFKYINPEARIRLAAGRAFFSDNGAKALQSGVSAMITGNMLTTKAAASIKADKEMIKRIGRI